MKKHEKSIKIILLCLSLSLLLCPILELGVGAYTPIASKELDLLTSLPDQSHLISVGLSSSEQKGKMDADKLADIGDLKYGISLIGVKEGSTLAHLVKAASDGIWSIWQSGDNNELGNLTWIPSGNRYNVSGDVDNEKGIYISLLTYNFGKIMDLEGVGYFTNNYNGMPRAADIYSSNDGVNWLLIGKYDGNQKRLDGGEFSNSGSNCYKDSLNGTVSTYPVWSLEGTTAQYLRIAIVKGAGATGSETYDSYSDETKNIAPREVVVFGTPNTELVSETDLKTKVAEYRGLQVTGVTDGHYGVRFVGVVQDLIGSEVGFQITATFGESRSEKYDTSCKWVYQSIQGRDDNGVRKYTAEQLGGKYVYALTVKDIPVEVGKITFTVTAYKMMNGETVPGSSFIVVVDGGTVVSQTQIQ